jgi:hypothetical protein
MARGLGLPEAEGSIVNRAGRRSSYAMPLARLHKGVPVGKIMQLICNKIVGYKQIGAMVEFSSTRSR